MPEDTRLRQISEAFIYAQRLSATLDEKPASPADANNLVLAWLSPLARHLNESRDQNAPRKAWTPWEIYVRDFVKRYKLDDEQAQKAQLVLNECEERAEIYVDSHKGEFLKIFESGIRMPPSPKADPEEKARRERLEQLLSPLTRIFEHQLKPRLEKLPTRAQRTAVGEK